MMEIAITKNRMELERLEGIIHKNLQSFYEVGKALMEIRDQGYYRDVLGYQTFEEYCRVKWDMSRPRAYQLIDAATIKNNLSTIVDTIPATESQTRPLSRLEPEKQKEAWQRAVDTAPNGKVTADHVYKIVKNMREPVIDKEPIMESNQEDTDAVFHLKRWWKRATKKDKQNFMTWVKEGVAR